MKSVNLSALNPQQRAAVRYIDGPLLVLAGAGSGKTRVITQKIAYLVRECGIKATHIAAVTFTNKAAREMKERVGQVLNAKERHGLKVSTFHTLGLNILRREHKALDYKPVFSIYDAQDSLQLIKELLCKEFGADDQAQRLQWQISAWKNDLVEPAEALLLAAGEPLLTAAASVYKHYDRCLKAYNAVDFDDLIRLPARLFAQQPQILERWQNRIRYLLVDEYQDTNGAQYRLVQQLTGARGALTVVGDDDQSIYAWRGARPENLARLSEDFVTLKLIKLEQNYRSMGNILKASNQLIANNPHVFSKSLWSELGYGEPIRVLQARDAEHEAEQVVADLIRHKFMQRSDFGDYAILYRGNHQSRLFEQQLREQRIPYRISGGISFFAATEVKDIMAYLRLLVNDDDDAAFLRVINTPKREIGPATLEKLSAYASARGISLCAAAYELGLAEHLPARAVSKLREFIEWLATYTDRAARGAGAELARELVADLGYAEWLEDTSKEPKAAERRMANVEELLDWMARMAEQEEGESSLAELVSRLTLQDILERNADEAGGDAVQLLTLHAAKGLEFPHVYIVGMEEELLPHRSSIEQEAIEEERRLAYVGITRARRTLTFSCAARRKRQGEWRECLPSRFLDELPQDDLRWSGAGRPVDKEQSQQKGKAHLDQLRGILKTP